VSQQNHQFSNDVCMDCSARDVVVIMIDVKMIKSTSSSWFLTRTLNCLGVSQTQTGLTSIIKINSIKNRRVKGLE
jgi:hypothetical protein